MRGFSQCPASDVCTFDLACACMGKCMRLCTCMSRFPPQEEDDATHAFVGAENEVAEEDEKEEEDAGRGGVGEAGDYHS